jgi:hypothetical protein
VDAHAEVGREPGQPAVPALADRTDLPRPGAAVDLSEDERSLGRRLTDVVGEERGSRLVEHHQPETVELAERPLGEARGDGDRVDVLAEVFEVEGQALLGAGLARRPAEVLDRAVGRDGLVVEDEVVIAPDLAAAEQQGGGVDVDAVVRPPDHDTDAIDGGGERGVLAASECLRGHEPHSARRTDLNRGVSSSSGRAPCPICAFHPLGSWVLGLAACRFRTL